MGVAAVVRRVPVEELGKFGVFEVPGVVPGEGAEKRQLPNPRQQPPRCRSAVRRPFVEASLQEHSPREFKGAAAGGEVGSANNLPAAVESRAPMGSIIYGAKSKGDDTARLVKEAIQSGFRHIATVRRWMPDDIPSQSI